MLSGMVLCCIAPFGLHGVDNRDVNCIIKVNHEKRIIHKGSIG